MPPKRTRSNCCSNYQPNACTNTRSDAFPDQGSNITNTTTDAVPHATHPRPHNESNTSPHSPPVQ